MQLTGINQTHNNPLAHYSVVNNSLLQSALIGQSLNKKGRVWKCGLVGSAMAVGFVTNNKSII